MLDLRDCTFVIPFGNNHSHRERNIVISLQHLFQQCRTRVIVVEISKRHTLLQKQLSVDLFTHIFFPQREELFHRTRAINIGAAMVKTPYLVIFDADTLVTIKQLKEAAKLMREEKASLVIPYDNRVMYIPSEEVEKLPKRITDAYLTSLSYPVTDDHYIFNGGINFFQTKDFFSVGMMNEYLQGGGYEDDELFMRMLKLSYPVLRTKGTYYHLSHRVYKKKVHHQYREKNKTIYYRTMVTNPDDIRRQVKKWPWVKDVFSRIV